MLGGQIIAVILALTGFISTNLAERSFAFPVLQSAGFYFILSFSLVSWPFPTSIPAHLYILLALLDVEANYLAVKAYQYTDMTSVLLLNSLTIPWIVVLSFLVLKRRYKILELVALFICLCGLGLVIASDTIRDRWGAEFDGKTPWIGDLLCVGSSFLYACQNVLQEYMLKRLKPAHGGSNAEYMGMLGAFGFIISTIQWLALEQSSLREAGAEIWTIEVIGLLVGFWFTMVVFYIILAWYIGKFDASLFNMNILTGGIYGILFEFAQNKSAVRLSSDWMYVTAYLLIIIGVVLYSKLERDKTSAPTAKLESREDSDQAN